jgi:hypothetical protein
MLMRLASIIALFLLLTCLSPAQQAGQNATSAAVDPGEPIAGDTQAQDAWR